MGTKEKIDLNSPKQNKCMDYHSPKQGWGGGGVWEINFFFFGKECLSTKKFMSYQELCSSFG